MLIIELELLFRYFFTCFLDPQVSLSLSRTAVYSSVSDHHACSLLGSARGGLMITNGGCRDCTRLVCVYRSYVCFVLRYISLSRMLSSSRTYAPRPCFCIYARCCCWHRRNYRAVVVPNGTCTVFPSLSFKLLQTVKQTVLDTTL